MSLTAIFAMCLLAGEALGHGMMMEPPNRSSRWRFDPVAPINYDDNQNFCGGFYVQWDINNGSCGVCGDIFTDPHPQANENTGIYGKGKIVRRYHSGTNFEVQILLTQNHLGTFSFSLCELEDVNAPEPGEECFEPLTLVDGSLQYHVNEDDTLLNLPLRLPEGKTCEHCVLRWHYRAGNNWGDCDDGTSGMGCGPQETFRSCADVAID